MAARFWAERVRWRLRRLSPWVPPPERWKAETAFQLRTVWWRGLRLLLFRLAMLVIYQGQRGFYTD